MSRIDAGREETESRIDGGGGREETESRIDGGRERRLSL